MKNGKFITLEGIEGGGKSTQLAFIEQYLKKQNITFTVTREPGGTDLGEKIRALLLTPTDHSMAVDTELLLMFAARAEHIEKVIKPALNRGEWVISDRFIDATFAYQGGGRGITEQRITQLADWTLGDLNIDLTFLFDLPVSLSQQRVLSRKQGVDRFEQEKLDFFERIRHSYLQRAEAEPARIKVIDASQTIDQIQLKIQSLLHALF